jgi:hypothetical protein
MTVTWNRSSLPKASNNVFQSLVPSAPGAKILIGPPFEGAVITSLENIFVLTPKYNNWDFNPGKAFRRIGRHAAECTVMTLMYFERPRYMYLLQVDICFQQFAIHIVLATIGRLGIKRKQNRRAMANASPSVIVQIVVWHHSHDINAASTSHLI